MRPDTDITWAGPFREKKRKKSITEIYKRHTKGHNTEKKRITKTENTEIQKTSKCKDVKG